MATSFSDKASAIEGVGKRYERTLGKDGVTTLRDLLSIQPEQLHTFYPVLSLQSLREWRAAAWLLTLDDMTPDLAECLVAAGIMSVSQLADAGLQTLERAVKTSEEKHQIKEPPSLYQLAALQRDAGRHRTDTVVVGFLHDAADGKIIETATARVGNRSSQVGPDGAFLITGVHPGPNVLVIAADGYPELRFRIISKSGRVTGPIKFKLKKLENAPEAKPLSERDGAQIQIRGDSRIRRKMVGLDELPDDTWLRYHQDYADGYVKLLHVHRTRIGRDVFTERVKLPRDDVPKDAKVGTMLHWKDAVLHVSDKTRQEIALEHFKKFSPPFEIKSTRTIVPRTRLERI